jgi:hypothetical protein
MGFLLVIVFSPEEEVIKCSANMVHSQWHYRPVLITADVQRLSCDLQFA